jgi:hypothetical protein
MLLHELQKVAETALNAALGFAVYFGSIPERASALP